MEQETVEPVKDIDWYKNREKELLRAITLGNRAYKRLGEKYAKLKKDKQVEHLQKLILKREAEIRRLKG